MSHYNVESIREAVHALDALDARWDRVGVLEILVTLSTVRCLLADAEASILKDYREEVEAMADPPLPPSEDPNPRCTDGDGRVVAFKASPRRFPF